MAFGSKKASVAGVGGDRLAAVAGTLPPVTSVDAASPSSPTRRVEPRQPDPSRIRPRAIEESRDERKRRLAAKTANFTATIIARIVIIAGAGLWAWKQYEFTGQIHRGVIVGVFVMFGDLGRVILKANEPGTK